MARALDGAIAELAPKTLGLLTYAQLDALGLTRHQRRALIANGTLVPVSPRVVRHAAHPRSHDQRVLAAVLTAGDGAVASHRSAATLWSFAGVEPGPVEITVAHDRRPRAVPATLHRSVDLGPADVDRRPVVPRTTPARTLLDIARQVDVTLLEAALDDAERRGLIWRPQLWWRIGELRRQGRPGIPAVAALLDRTEGRPLGDSWLEQQAIRVIVSGGLPTPHAQVTLRRRGGGVARVDLLWEPARLIAELAGHGTHATRRQRQADAERAARLGLDGWQVVTFTYEDVVERPVYVVDILRTYLTTADR